MAKRQTLLLCSRCEAPFRAQTAFCAECGGPTPWATHEERVAWEVRQWRASRAREPERGAPMMLVRTDEGFQPAPVDPRTQYVWDQPLHPEREQQETPANGHAANGNGSNGKGSHGHATPAPVAPAAEAPREAPSGEPPVAPPTPPVAPPVAPLVASVPEPAPEPVPLPDVGQPPAQTKVPTPPPVEAPRGETVSISKKAVAVAIALAVGLPLGGKALNLAGSEQEASRKPGTAAKARAPAALAAARSGYVQLSGDAVRYALLIRNPNRALSAHNVTVSVSLFDAKGRFVGTDVERLPVVFAASTAAIAGTTGVDGRVARLSVRLSSDGFVETRGKPFTVRSVALSRSGRDLVVRAALTAAHATRGARVVAVHLDARGAIVGGDVAYVDIPRSPRSVTAAIRTAGAGARVRRVQVYVLAPR